MTVSVSNPKLNSTKSCSKHLTHIAGEKRVLVSVNDMLRASQKHQPVGDAFLPDQEKVAGSFRLSKRNDASQARESANCGGIGLCEVGKHCCHLLQASLVMLHCEIRIVVLGCGSRMSQMQSGQGKNGIHDERKGKADLGHVDPPDALAVRVPLERIACIGRVVVEQFHFRHGEFGAQTLARTTRTIIAVTTDRRKHNALEWCCGDR